MNDMENIDVNDSGSDDLTNPQDDDFSAVDKNEPEPRPEPTEPDAEIEVNDTAYKMSSPPETAEGYEPNGKDAKDIGLIFDDRMMTSFKQFAKSNEISTGLFQRLVSFQLKLINDNINDDDMALKRFEKFSKSERLNSNLFNAIVSFQKNWAAEYQKSIEQIQVSSVRASGRPNPNAHAIHILSNSSAYNDKRHKGHSKAIEKMITLCSNRGGTK